MHKEGLPFVLLPLAAAAAAGVFQWIPWILVPLFLLLAGFCAFFFRDPERVIPADPALMVSPADGRVVRITTIQDDHGHTLQRISIFLSVFNVHINRLPLDGRIADIRYSRGKYLAAFNHKASEENERNCLWLTYGGRTFRITQIAGLIARRIVCWKKPGDEVRKGERFGLIRFGSRVDLDLPEEAEILVKIGDRVRGGSSVVARLRAE
jgi:phosphatidylserine decarboxylase